MKKFYITTAIDYVNDVIHIGHAYQKVVADVLARYHRLIGDEVFFLTGTDEYGQKNEKAAKVQGISPRKFVNKISTQSQKEIDSLNISYNRYIKTTDKDHYYAAQHIFEKVYQNGDIYLGKYHGLYCEGCEAYLTQSELVDGKCKYHLKKPIPQTEENFFFRWSKYQNFLKKHILKNKKFILPEARHNEMLSFLEHDLSDIPVSRTTVSWGIKVPGHRGHVIYVWFDALVNYLTGIGYPDKTKLFKKFWPADIHLLGKDNVRWHALLWPAMLKSAKLPLPKTIYGHGFLNLNGQKISKSLGNIIRPSALVSKYGVDPVRYYLLRYTTLDDDSDLSEERLITIYNADLANGLGNLISRVAKLCSDSQLEFSNPKKISIKTLSKRFDRFEIHQGLDDIWGFIADTDKLIDDTRPWKLISATSAKLLSRTKVEERKAQSVLQELVDRIRAIALLLKPFLPETAEKIENQFIGSKIKVEKPLFPRLPQLEADTTNRQRPRRKFNK